MEIIAYYEGSDDKAEWLAAILGSEPELRKLPARNSTKDFTGAEELAWFIEGLAVFVSGQLEEGHIAPAREALELDLAPESLANAWSGKYRYGVCGSLARYLDVTCGRARLREMLACTSQEELLEVAGLQEQELLERWKESVRGPE